MSPDVAPEDRAVPDDSARAGASESSSTPAPVPPVDAGAGAASGPAVAPDATGGAVAAHCLYAGPEDRVVQCYWKAADCERQIAFNREYGSTRAQDCRPSSVVYCLTPSASSETCYPTAAGCDDMHAKLVARGRATSTCAEKTGPTE